MSLLWAIRGSNRQRAQRLQILTGICRSCLLHAPCRLLLCPSLLASPRPIQACANLCIDICIPGLRICGPPVCAWWQVSPAACRVILFGVTVAFYIILAVGVNRGLKWQLGVGLTPWPSWAWWIAAINSWLWMSLGAVAICGRSALAFNQMLLSGMRLHLARSPGQGKLLNLLLSVELRCRTC